SPGGPPRLAPGHLRVRDPPRRPFTLPLLLDPPLQHARWIRCLCERSAGESCRDELFRLPTEVLGVPQCLNQRRLCPLTNDGRGMLGKQRREPFVGAQAGGVVVPTYKRR